MVGRWICTKHLFVVGRDEVVVAHDGDIAVGACSVLGPLSNIVWVYGVIQKALKGDSGHIQAWPLHMSVLDGHEYVIDPYGSYPVE